MTRIDNFLNVFGLQRRSYKAQIRPSSSVFDWTSDDVAETFEMDTQQLSMYEKAAAAYSNNDLVYACLSKLGDMAGRSKLMLFDPDAPADPDTGHPNIADAIPQDGHPFYTLLDQPNAATTRHNFLKRLFICYLLSDNGSFTHLDDGERSEESGTQNARIITVETTKPPQALWNILPFRVKPKKGKNQPIDKFVVDANTTGPTYHFTPESMMWLRDVDPLDDLSSLSKYQPMRLAVDFDHYASTANVQLFKNALRPSAVIEADRPQVNPDELAMLQKLWEEQLKGADNWHKLLPLWGGFRLKPIGFTPAEAEYLQGTVMARSRIFATFGVHPGLILSENVNLANARVADIATRRYTLEPMLSAIADGFTSQILPLYGEEAPAAVAHFVNVVPEDRAETYKIQQSRANASQAEAQAILTWMKAYGPREGLLEAQRQGLVADEVNINAVVGSFETMPEDIKAALFSSTDGSVQISERDIQKVLEIWKSMFEDGVLEAENHNPYR